MSEPSKESDHRRHARERCGDAAVHHRFQSEVMNDIRPDLPVQPGEPEYAFDFLPRPDSGARKFDRVINEPLALHDFGIVPARRRDVNLEPRFPCRPRQIDPVRVERPDVIVYIKEALSGICVAHKFRRGADTG